METIVTFIIPVRHQDNAKDWPRLKANLTQTLRSISGQTDSRWRAVVVANEGADLPILPQQCEHVRVHFPPNEMHERQQSRDKEDFYDAFRIDKGRRVLSGMLYAVDTKFYMIVDDDDFVSSNIVAFAAANVSANGWKIDKGYVWGDGGALLFAHDDFANFCGTSLIVRADLYTLPAKFEDAQPNFIKTMLGSHIQIGKILAERGSPLGSLPFRGAIYRVGHPGAHSTSPGLLKMYLFNKSIVRKPILFCANLLRFRWLTPQIRSAYFGEPGSE
jgi:hypothetical protein